MLPEKDLDIVLVATPDHWHALPMIAAVEAGADVYVQKPISVDVVEGQAMLAAARKHKRVVQVGMQRRSTPHLIEARDRIFKEGKLGKVGLVEIYCYYHMRHSGNPPDTAPPDYLDYEMWTGPAPLRPYNAHRASARLAGVHGVRQRHHGRHVRPHARHGPLDARPGLAEADLLRPAGFSCEKGSKANISDTQTATFDYGDLDVVWQHRTWGDAPDPKYPWGATFYGDKGTLKASVIGYDFTRSARASRSTRRRSTNTTISRGPDRKGPRTARRPGDPRAHADFLRRSPRAASPWPTSKQGHISTRVASSPTRHAARPNARLGPRTRQVVGDRRPTGGSGGVSSRPPWSTREARRLTSPGRRE